MTKACLSLWILCSSGSLVLAQSNDSVLRLTGIISLPDFRRALLESPGPRQKEGFNLAEGERQGRIEVLTVSQQADSVEVFEEGRKATLKLEGPTASVDDNTRSNLRLSNASLQQVLDAYARLSGRTVLQHPAIKATTVSLNATAKNRTEAAASLEKLFQEHGLTSIPDGAKFVIIIPSQMTNTVTAKSSGIVPKTTENAPIPTGTIHFDSVDLSQALAVYGHLIGRKLVRSDGLRTAMIRLRTVNDLTAAQAAHALETLFRWSGVKVVPIGDSEFQAVPIR